MKLSKNLQCVCVRNGIQIWLEQDRVENLKANLKKLEKSTFIELPGGQVVNSADLTGIFSAKDIEELTHRKNGEWKCRYGNFHQKYEKCECAEIERLEEERKKTKKLGKG